MHDKNKINLAVALLPFSERLARFMGLVGSTQDEGAAAMGVTVTTFQNYLYGKTFPAVDKVEALAAKFGYPSKWFFQGDAEITVEEIKQAVMLVEKALANKALDDQKKATAIALTARTLAREAELDQKGDLEGRIKKFVEETLSLLQ
jgi:transcriptional regulator with XRE-family HTH domain